MQTTRRQFLATSATLAAGFSGLRIASAESGGLRQLAPTAIGYGPLIKDTQKLLDLPQGFSYRVIGRVGDEMADGLLVPGYPDGMAAFPGPDGLTLLMRNHELFPTEQSAFGPSLERLAKIDPAKLYDAGAPDKQGNTLPSAGGVTTVVYDTKRQQVVRQFLALGGTIRNCAGGPAPWGAWLSCEEAVDSPTYSEKSGYVCQQEHGYLFETPASAEPTLHAAKPIKAMGRFRREAVAVDPESGIVYQTEDMNDGAFYRFIPNKPGDLAAGGRLQALAVAERPGLDTRNWPERLQGMGQTVEPGHRHRVEWIDLDDVESPADDLRYRAFDQGAARFARGEGIWWGEDVAYFACTTGGHAELGQLWKYTPEEEGGWLELFIEPNDSELLHNADNLTIAPWGDLVVCEDRKGPVIRLIGVTPAGDTYVLANNQADTEFAGACFSPDGSTLFVNVQKIGVTLAITGPWHERA